MSNAVTQRGPDPVTQLRTQITSMADQFRSALPSHIKPEKFQRVVLTVVQQQPALMNADRKTLLASCLKCAADGLIPDGREAALVLFGGNVQYMPMLAGIQKRIRNSGEVAGIEAHVIYEHDKFVWVQGIDNKVEHTPLFPGDRGKPIGAYAIARFKDGSLPQFEVMDVAAIERVRNVSRAKNSGPWSTWWDEMARKTVFRRLSKWLPMDADVDTLLARDEENERAPVISGEVVQMPTSGASKLDALAAPTRDPVDLLVADFDTCPDVETLGGLEREMNQIVDAGVSTEVQSRIEDAHERASRRLEAKVPA